MRPPAREHFRNAPHSSGTAIAKPKDYEPAGEVEAASVYGAWIELRADRPLETGDILEDEQGALFIAKYIGFDSAQWWVPEPKLPAAAPASVAADGSAHESVEVQPASK